MTEYCGEVKAVPGVTGGGYVAVANENAQGNVTVHVGGLMRGAAIIGPFSPPSAGSLSWPCRR